MVISSNQLITFHLSDIYISNLSTLLIQGLKMTGTFNETMFRQRNFLYLLPVTIFAILLALRNSNAYGFIFEYLPILGRTMPFLVLSILLVAVFISNGGSLKDLGMRTPKGNKTTRQVIIWLLLWAIGILFMRIVLAVAIDPVIDSLTKTQNDSKRILLAGNITLLFGLLPIMWIVVIGEELLIRGLLMNFLAKVFGGTAKAWIIAILISAIIFGLGHWGKGLSSMISSGLAGVVFGLGYYFSGKNIWPVILAHCAGNTIGFVGAYFSTS